MRAINQLPVVLFFTNSTVPTDDEAAEIAGMTNVNVKVRNAAMVDPFGAEALEECDGVAGKVPEIYRRVFPGSPGEVSGVGALRVIHGNEPGVSENQPSALDSRYTGDPFEEMRRRSARGLAVNDPNGKPVWPNAATVKSVPTGDAIGSPAGPAALDPTLPMGVNGASRVTMDAAAASHGSAPMWGPPVDASQLPPGSALPADGEAPKGKRGGKTKDDATA